MKIARIFVASLMAFGVSALAMPPPMQAQTQPSYADQAVQQPTTMTVVPMLVMTLATFLTITIQLRTNLGKDLRSTEKARSVTHNYSEPLLQHIIRSGLDEKKCADHWC